MFELLLVMLTITSPFILIALIRHYFSHQSTPTEERLLLLQDIQSKQIAMEKSIDNLLERIAELEVAK